MPLFSISTFAFSNHTSPTLGDHTALPAARSTALDLRFALTLRDFDSPLDSASSLSACMLFMNCRLSRLGARGESAIKNSRHRRKLVGQRSIKATVSSFALCGGSGDIERRVELTRKFMAWCVDIKIRSVKVEMMEDWTSRYVDDSSSGVTGASSGFSAARIAVAASMRRRVYVRKWST